MTCVLSVVFGNMLRLDGGSMNYVVPLLMQSTITIDIRELFFSMAFIANSGALMDLSMDIALSLRRDMRAQARYIAPCAGKE